MSPASTQRLTAIGTLCRRPTALLLPLTPLVLLVFAGILIVGSVRAALAGRFPAQLETEADELSAPEPAAAPTTRLARGFSAVRPTPRRAVSGAFALLAGVLVAAGMAGGTYAFLNSQASIPAVTVKSGSLALTVQYGATTAGTTTAIPTTAWATMLPGDFVGQQFTIASTGSATANVTARLSAVTAWDIRIATGACPATQLTSAPLTTSAAAQSQIAAATSTVFCVQATLPAGAAAAVEATTAPFTILLDATQVPTP
jgi:hypothetical protein